MQIKIINPVVQQHSVALLAVEKGAWQSEGENITAAEEKIRARIDSFSQGITLALDERGEPVGSQYAFRFDWDGGICQLGSWDDHTAFGWTHKVHVPKGNTGFLVGVGVIPEARGIFVTHDLRWKKPMRTSSLLIAKTLDTLFDLGVQRVIANARIPFYHQRSNLSVDEYCTLRRDDNELFDPVLRFHERMGATLIKPVSYSLEDVESLNGGCWVLYQHRFEG